MSNYIASDDRNSVDCSVDTVLTVPTSLRESWCGSDYSQAASVDPAYTGINWGRLAGYIQPDQKMEKRGWFWEHGYDIQRRTDTKTHYWLCRACHTAHLPRTIVFASRGVDNIKKHLLKYHQLDRDGRPTKRRRHEFDNLALDAHNGRDQKIMNYFNSTFDSEHWKKLLVRWVVRDQIPLWKVESEHFQSLCRYANKLTASTHCLPHHTTLRKMIISEYNRHKGIVTELLRAARSKIHMSFDLWTSRKLKCFAGAVVHFVGDNDQFYTFLLALPEQATSHAGIEIAETIKSILTEFGIGESQIGYFVADNASENDTCLEDLAVECNFNKGWRRLRCMGHVINLVARMLLFGSDPNGFAEDLEDTADDRIKQMEQWRKFGPVGKLHDIMVWVGDSPERLRQFYNHQRSEYIVLGTQMQTTNPIYDPVLANGTRWNSNKAEMERGVRLRNAIDSMIGVEVSKWNQYWSKITRNGTCEPPRRHRKKPDIVDDILDSDDWSVITIYLEMLAPLEQATMRLQGRPGAPTGGYIWEILPVFEWLLRHFEELKVRYDNHPNPHFRSNVNLAWMKLDKYYALTDNSPVYVAGVVFHPRMKWGFVEKHWAEKPDWRDRAKEAVRKLWEAEYKNLPLPSASESAPEPSEVAYTSGLNDLLESLISPPVPQSDVDEYEEYCNRKDPEDINCSNPFAYWLSKRAVWPRLSQMALDIVSIPCMSDEPERIFSLAGVLTASRRARAGSDLIGASLCLADWDKRGVVDILEKVVGTLDGESGAHARRG